MMNNISTLFYIVGLRPTLTYFNTHNFIYPAITIHSMEATTMMTSIQITTQTRDRLKYYGIKDETYDSILNKLMDKWDSTAKK